MRTVELSDGTPSVDVSDPGSHAGQPDVPVALFGEPP